MRTRTRALMWAVLWIAGLAAAGCTTSGGTSTSRGLRSYYDERDPAVTTVTQTQTITVTTGGTTTTSPTTPTTPPSGPLGQLGPPSGPVIDHSVNSACGTELWAKKTLTDPGAGAVDSSPLAITSRSQLDSVSDSGAGGSNRVGIEQHVYEFTGTLLLAKQEADSDLHVVMEDKSGKTLVTEYPAPACVQDASPAARADMIAARQAFVQACGQPSTSGFTMLTGTATVDGVGFYDRDHGQTDRDSLGDGWDVELHPILRFTGGCG